MPNLICANQELRKLIINALERADLPEAEKQREVQFWKTLPDCDGNVPARTSTASHDETGRYHRRRQRAPSAYNLFIGECLRERHQDLPRQERLTACAADWKAKKARGGK